jgi:hypothetical protein
MRIAPAAYRSTKGCAWVHSRAYALVSLTVLVGAHPVLLKKYWMIF